MKWRIEERMIVLYIVLSNLNTKDDEHKRLFQLFCNIQNRKGNSAKNTFGAKKSEFSGDFSKELSEADQTLVDRYSSNPEELLNKINEIEKNILGGWETIDHKGWDDKERAVVEYNSTSLKVLLSDARIGRVKIPLFQRDFEWKANDIKSFLNSVLKGYPFGSVVKWESGYDLKIRNNYIKCFTERESYSTGDQFVIDGQQRLTSYVSQLIDGTSTQESKKVVFDIQSRKFEIKSDVNNIGKSIPSELLISDNTDKLSEFLEAKKATSGLQVKLNSLQNKILNTKIGETMIKSADLNDVINIFSNMNTKGKRLSLFSLIHAKWQQEKIDINLEFEINNSFSKKNDKRFNLNNDAITQAIYIILEKGASLSSREILETELSLRHKEGLVNAFKIINQSAEFLFDDMGYKKSLLPSKINFLSTCYFKMMKPSADQTELWRKYLRLANLNNRYSSSTTAKLKEDIIQINKIINENKFDIELFDKRMFTKEMLLKTKYNEGSSRYNMAVSMMFDKTISLTDGTKVPVFDPSDGKTMQIHHIVPSKMELADGRKVEELDTSNTLSNLMPITAADNNKIDCKAPNTYLKEFCKESDYLSSKIGEIFITDKEVMESIVEKSSEDMVNNFIEHRAEKLSVFLNEKFNFTNNA